MLALMLTSLVACRACPTKVEIREVKVEVTVPLDPKLTRQEPKPARPAAACKDLAGRPTICNSALAEWLAEYDAAMDKINGRMADILKLQPKAAP